MFLFDFLNIIQAIEINNVALDFLAVFTRHKRLLLYSRSGNSLMVY